MNYPIPNNYGADKFEIMRRIRREIKRREQVAAFALSDNKLATWDDALKKICRLAACDDISPIKVIKKLVVHFNKLASIPLEDKAFMQICSTRGKRTFLGHLLTLKFDNHPLIGEPNCLVGQYHSIVIGRPISQSSALYPGVSLAPHALERLQERADIKLSFIIESMLLLTLFAIVIRTMSLGGTEDKEILIKLQDVVFVGCVRCVGSAALGRAGNLIDIRTILSTDMLFPEQLRRAEHVGDLVSRVFDDLEAVDEEVKDLVLPPAKPDYVSLNSQVVINPFYKE